VVVTPRRKIEIQVIDQGDGFEATDADFDVMAAAAARTDRRHGAAYIRRSMDTVTNNATHRRNKLIMIKRC
jgi:anti-sigma regulatory factor (Ser/Thr protein kinase)